MTQRLPEESKAVPSGAHNPVDEAGELVHMLPVKSLWPMTRLAASPSENGALNSRTLLLNGPPLLKPSVTHRLPEESNEMAFRPSNCVAEAGEKAQFTVVKSFSPMTRLAASPVENGAAYSRTLQ